MSCNGNLSKTRPALIEVVLYILRYRVILLCRTLLWLSVVSLPLLGMAWILAVLSVSERLSLLSYMLSVAVLAHALFALIGYCFLNTRVRRNLYVSLLRCVGKKVPLDSSEGTTGGTSSHSHQGGTAGQQHTVRTISQTICKI